MPYSTHFQKTISNYFFQIKLLNHYLAQLLMELREYKIYLLKNMNRNIFICGTNFVDQQMYSIIQKKSINNKSLSDEKNILNSSNRFGGCFV